MALSAGTQLGPYTITGAIGAGGMGEVYRAHDTRLNRDIAIKVLPASVSHDPDRLARFQREAQVLAALNHPNIAQIYGIEEVGSGLAPGETRPLALVMELVEGPTLADIIGHGHPEAASVGERLRDSDSAARRGGGTAATPEVERVRAKPRAHGDSGTSRGGGAPRGLSLDDALAIARQIADALEAAHEQGIVHRDLKPANVKVREDGTVKVLDFGLAKALATDASGDSQAVMNSPTLTARATQLGVILGTAAYMAPEQAKGRTVDRRADIWAFGVVLFEMLTGRRGFEAEDVSETLAAVLTREVDWTALPASTPARIRTLLHDCLVRDPRQRLRDIGDARRVIDRVIEGVPDEAMPATASAAAPPPPLWRRALPWAVATVAVATAAVVGVVALRRPAAAPSLVTRSELTLTDQFAGFVDVSPDGTKVAYTLVGGQATTLIGLRMTNQFEGRTISGSEGGAFPLFSPDGQWIAFQAVQGGALKKMPLTGGTAITLCDGNFLQGAAWGGDTIVFAGSKGLMRVAAGGGTPETLTTIDTAKGETAHIYPQFLPGGGRLLFTVVSKGEKDAPPVFDFAVLDLTSGTYKKVAKGGIHGQYVASGHLIYVQNATLFAVPFDLDRLTVTGDAVPMVEGISTVGPDRTGDYSVSNTGLLTYVAVDPGNQGTTLAWADRKGALRPLPGRSQRLWGTGRLSPDGRHLANAIHAANGASDIWIVDVERGTPTRVTFGGTNDYPVWTPDSRQVIYGGTEDGKPGLYEVAADASGKRKLLLATETAATPSSVSPDGRTLLYTQKSRIIVLALPVSGDAKPRPLHDTTSAEGEAQVSPDGHRVAYVSQASGRGEIYLQAFPKGGATVRVSTEGGSKPRWAHDGRTLYYWGAESQLFSVAIPPGDALQPGPPQLLFSFFAGTTWDVTPDPNRFLVEETSRQGGTRIATVTNWFEELRQRAPAKR